MIHETHKPVEISRHVKPSCTYSLSLETGIDKLIKFKIIYTNILRILYFHVIKIFYIELVIIFTWTIISIMYLVFKCLFIKSCHVLGSCTYTCITCHISSKLYPLCRYHIVCHTTGKYHASCVMHIISHVIYRVIL